MLSIVNFGLNLLTLIVVIYVGRKHLNRVNLYFTDMGTHIPKISADITHIKNNLTELKEGFFPIKDRSLPK